MMTSAIVPDQGCNATLDAPNVFVQLDRWQLSFNLLNKYFEAIVSHRSFQESLNFRRASFVDLLHHFIAPLVKWASTIGRSVSRTPSIRKMTSFMLATRVAATVAR